MFRPYLQSLPEAQRQLWPLLTPLRELGFVLYGGTAIALRLGHRVSIDFDFFSAQSLNRGELMKAMPVLATAIVLQDAQNTLSARVPIGADAVQLSLFGGIDFGRVSDPDQTEDGVLEVASQLDLLGTKLAVILQRVALKDYVDIAALLSGGIPLSAGLAAAGALYGSSFSSMESMRALTWFEGGDLDRLSAQDRAILTEAVARVKALPKLMHLRGLRVEGGR